MDPAVFLAENLVSWRRPVVVYRCVGKYDEESMERWLSEQDAADVLSVFVGASSSVKERALELSAAQKLRAEVNPALQLGGVAIPERHSRTGSGTTAWSPNAAGRRVVLRHAGRLRRIGGQVDAVGLLLCLRRRGLAPVPVIFTLSVCGSMKTVEFLEWLGVDVPPWLRNDLAHADDPLSVSFDQCLATAAELTEFAKRIGTPHGSTSSVSDRRREIEASVELAARMRS